MIQISEPGAVATGSARVKVDHPVATAPGSDFNFRQRINSPEHLSKRARAEIDPSNFRDLRLV